MLELHSALHVLKKNFKHPLQSLMEGCLMFSHHHSCHLIWAPINVYQCLMFSYYCHKLIDVHL
jgi:hypothetical protein